MADFEANEITLQVDSDPSFPSPREFVRRLASEDIDRRNLDLVASELPPGKWFARTCYGRDGKRSLWSDVETIEIS